MKGLKLASLAMASLMALSLVGCGPVEDSKVRFLRECKQSLSAEECQQLAYNKSQEEQARIMKNGAYNQSYSQPAYGQQTYGQPAPVYSQPQSTFVDTAAGAVVGGVAGAMIGNAMSNTANTRRQEQDVYKQYNTQPPAAQYRATATPPQQPAVKASVVAPRPSVFNKPAAPAPTQLKASSPFSKPAAPKPVTATKSVSSPKPSVFNK